MLVYTKWGIERERERGGWRGAWEDRGGYQEVLFFLFFIFYFWYIYIYLFFFFVFPFFCSMRTRAQVASTVDIQMLVARDDSVKIHRQLFVAGI